MKLYIGMDFGWKSFRYEVRNSKGCKLQVGGGKATPKGLQQVLKKYKKHPWVQVAFEAGVQMHWIHEVVTEMGMESYPFHAASFFQIVKSKKKTDKKDAERIAEAASKDNLPPRLVVSTESERELRELVKERKAYQKELVCWGNRLRALGSGLGFELECGCLSEQIENWDKALRRFEGTRHAESAHRLYKAALPLFQLVEEVDERIRHWEAEVPAEWNEAQQQLESIPGIGERTALVLLAWCGPRAARFATPRHAASYFGLTGEVDSSGTIVRMKGITKCGPPLVRSLMVQAAWAFLNSKAGRESRWGEWFRKRTYKNKSQRKKSIIGLARKLLTAAVACLQKGTYWDADVLNRVPA